MTSAILFSQMEPRPLTAEFHDWYENDHIPARMALPRFQGARRFRALVRRARLPGRLRTR